MANQKETYYFSHDANARNDEKVLMLRAEHGMEGYGIYWALLEMMFESTDSTLSHNKTKGIAVSYNVDITLLENVINTAITESLFVSDGEKFWSESLIRRKEKFHDLKKKRSEAGKKGMAKRWSNQQSDNTDITKDSIDITKNNKGKESKGNKSKESNSHKRVYDDSSIYFILAKRLYDNILKNNPNHKQPNLQQWANDIRLMMERDKRNEEQIKYLIDWCQENDFWKSNILSVSKLREKFDQLVIQIKSSKGQTQVKKPPVYEVGEENEGSNGKDANKFGNVRLFR